MMKYTRDYSIEWKEECQANSFEEAEKILDAQAVNNAPDITFYGEVEKHDE